MIGIYGEDAEVSIGENVCFNANIIIDCQKYISIGDNVMFGPNVYITDHDHDFHSSNWRDEYSSSDVVIGKNVWIGAGVTILNGTTIGDNCVIGAGTILKGNYQENTIYNTDRKLVSRIIDKR